MSEARVRIDGEIVGEIGAGFMILYCAEAGDGDDAVRRLAEKTAKLRVLPMTRENEQGDHDIGGSALVVSQFTAANTAKGNRPSFIGAAAPDEGARYDAFCAALAALGVPIETGRFGADMQVELINDGPVTILEIPRRRLTGHFRRQRGHRTRPNPRP